MSLSPRCLSVLDQIFTYLQFKHIAHALRFYTISSMIYLAAVSLMINRPISTCGVLFWRTVARFAIWTLRGQGGQSGPLDSEKFAKNREKEGENQEKKEEIGKKRKNREGCFTLPLLTDRAGYTPLGTLIVKGTKWCSCFKRNFCQPSISDRMSLHREWFSVEEYYCKLWVCVVINHFKDPRW